MSLALFLLVLLAAFFHAVWNVLVKGGGNPLFETGLVALGAFFPALLAVFFLPLPTREALPWLFASALIHSVYYAFLAVSFGRTELVFSYTLMRGLAPVLTSLVLMLTGVVLGALALTGVLLLCTGVFCLAFEHRSGTVSLSALWQDLLAPLATAVVISIYTLVDGYGARGCGNPFSYACWLFVLQMVPVNIFLLLRYRERYLSYGRSRLSACFLGGMGSFLSYTIAIYAMTCAPIALVAALRESSVVFGMLLAVFFLHERMTVLRLTSVLLVLLGAVMIRLA